MYRFTYASAILIGARQRAATVASTIAISLSQSAAAYETDRMVGASSIALAGLAQAMTATAGDVVGSGTIYLTVASGTLVDGYKRTRVCGIPHPSMQIHKTGQTAYRQALLYKVV